MGLFTPVYMKKGLRGRGEEKAVSKIESMTDQGKLTRIFREAPEKRMREEAAWRLTGLKAPEALLAEIAERSDQEYIAKRAVDDITDDALLERIAESGSLESIRERAARYVSDQAALERLARGAGDQKVRETAVGKLENPDVLQDIALHDADSGIRHAAVIQVTDAGTLGRIALSDPDPEVRASAARNENLTDPAVLAEVALHDSSSLVRYAAVKGGKLTDPDTLKSIALDRGPNSPREEAIQMLDDVPALEEIARESDTANPMPRWLAALRLSEIAPDLAVAPLVHMMELDRNKRWNAGEFRLRVLRIKGARFLESRYRETKDPVIAGLPDGMYGWVDPAGGCLPDDEMIHFDLARGRN